MRPGGRPGPSYCTGQWPGHTDTCSRSDYATRMYSGRPSSSMWFSTFAAMATSVACSLSVYERSPSPMTRFHLEMPASARARQLYPDARCQPMRPRTANIADAHPAASARSRLFCSAPRLRAEGQ